MVFSFPVFTLVDLTTIGLRPNPKGLRRLAEGSNLDIIMGVGWYRESVYPN